MIVIIYCTAFQMMRVLDSYGPCQEAMYWRNLAETCIFSVILSLLDESRNTTTQFTTLCI
jgi:hypothetical protein